jgi:ribosomal 50S subunit-recycling heat shock protein
MSVSFWCIVGSHHSQLKRALKMADRLQKFLAARGLGSRREIEGWIERGEIQVNGRVAKLGDQVDAGDTILVRGKPVKSDERAHRWVAYHKPEGEICTRSDPEGRSSVFASLPRLRGQQSALALGRVDLRDAVVLLRSDGGDGLFGHQVAVHVAVCVTNADGHVERGQCRFVRGLGFCQFVVQF